MVDPGQSLLDHLNKQHQARQARASFKGAPKIGTGGRFIAPKAKGPGTTFSAPKPQSSGGGGGFFHDIGNVVHTVTHGVEHGANWTRSKGDLAAHDIQAMPAGFVKTGEALSHDAAHVGGLVNKGLGLKQSSYEKAHSHGWETPGIGKAIAKGTYDSVRHPLRDPFQGLLTAFAVASLGAGAAARVAGGAARVGEAADEASLASKIGAAAKGVAEKPKMPNRIIDRPALRINKQDQIESASTPTQLTASQKPLVRAAQELHDRILQRSLWKHNTADNTTSLVNKYANRRIGHSISETNRRTENMAQGDAMAIQAAGHGVGRIGRKRIDTLTRQEANHAILLRDWNALPHEYRDALDKANAGLPETPAVNKLSNLMHDIHMKDVLRLDKKGDVVINKAKYPALHAASKLTGASQKAREAVIKDYGLMQPESMAARRDLPGEIIGTGRSGKGYTNLATSEKDLPRYPRPAGESGGVIGKKQGFIRKTVHATGEGILKGLVPDDTIAGIARSFKQAMSYKQAMDARHELWKGGSDVSRHASDVFIRDPFKPVKPLSQEAAVNMGKEMSTLHTLPDDQGLEQAFRQHMDDVIHPRKAGRAGIEAEGGRYVSRHAVGDLGKTGAPRGTIARKMDAFNSAVTTGTVYAKPSHVPQRYVTDAITSLFSGALTSRKTGQFVKNLEKSLTPQEHMAWEQATGLHGYLALPHEGESLAARSATKGANFFAQHVDARFRRMNLAHEAQKVGINTPQEFRKLLKFAKDPSKRIKIADAQKYEQVLRRTDRTSMMYDGLTPTERATVSRAIWFYPWMKAATRFGGHVAAEHPLAAAGMTAEGHLGRDWQKKEFGALPSFGLGYIPLEGGRKESSAGWLAPFNTTGQVIQTAMHPHDIAQNLNPATQVAASMLGLGGGAASGNALSEGLSPLPEFSILKDYLNPSFAKKKTHLFPHNPSEDWLTRFGIGPSYPRRINRKAAHRDARTGGYDIHIYPKKH